MAGCLPLLGHSCFPPQSIQISSSIIINWQRKWGTGKNKHAWDKKRQSPATPKSQQTPVNLRRGGRPEEELKSWLRFQSLVKKAYSCFLQEDSQSPLLYDLFGGGVEITPKLQCVTPKFGRSWRAEGHTKPTEIICKINTAFAGNSWLQSYPQQAPNRHISGQKLYGSLQMLMWIWGKNLAEVRVPTPSIRASEDPRADVWYQRAWEVRFWLRTTGFGQCLQVVQTSLGWEAWAVM